MTQTASKQSQMGMDLATLDEVFTGFGSPTTTSDSSNVTEKPSCPPPQKALKKSAPCEMAHPLIRRSKRQSRLSMPHKPPAWVGPLWAIGTLLLVGGLLGLGFVSSSSGPRTKPIGEVQLGERTNAHNPKGDYDDRFGIDVDPATWRQIHLRAEKEPGGSCWIELLRPLWWLELNQAKVGGRIHISIPECGVNDDALVLSIGPCPPISPGKGPIITGKFTHDAAQVINIYIEGQAKPIGSTPNHRFWSVDRQHFIRVDELKPGETLQASGHTAKFVKSVARNNLERVYNLEIQGEHVYRVGGLGVLVHNTGDDLCDFSQLAEDVLYRIQRGDKKGRPFGTPRNPRVPTLEEFNPRIAEIRAGDLEKAIVNRKHGIFPDQAKAIGGMSDDELIRFRMNDPISGTGSSGNLSLTGGHHRTAEIINRVKDGKLSPDTIIKFLLHD